ncbi:unnamed protein product, partial [Allacma fusca]
MQINRHQPGRYVRQATPPKTAVSDVNLVQSADPIVNP